MKSNEAQKNKIKNKPKIIVVLGPTATGKSDFAVRLAKEFNGEIISADSRQVYKGLDIGSGKITKKEMSGVPHYLLDVVSARTTFSVVDFQKKAYKIIDDILRRGKVPIIAGGTGFYIQSVVEGLIFPNIKRDPVLRKKLESMSLEKLQKKLQKLDPARFSEIDQQNKVRLIRAIEIASQMSSVPKLQKDPRFEVLQIGLTWSQEVLDKRIHDRLLARMKIGMVSEIRRLHNSGISWRRMDDLGLEYRYLSRFVCGKLSKEEMLEQLETKIRQFSKRQTSWWKRDKSIKWFSPKEYSEAKKLIERFLR